MKKEVRAAEMHDIEYIFKSLQDDLQEQHVKHRFKYSEETFKNLIFGNEPIAKILILLINDEYAGFVNYSIDNRNYTTNYLRNLYMHDLYVNKNYRRMGGATLLFNTLVQIAHKEQCGRIEWLVQVDNPDAMSFYNSLQTPKILNSLYYMRFELN